MIRVLVLFALAAGLSGCAAASSFFSAPSSSGGAAPARGYYYQPGVPRSEYECMMDEGYGRSVPCGNQS